MTIDSAVATCPDIDYSVTSVLGQISRIVTRLVHAFFVKRYGREPTEYDEIIASRGGGMFPVTIWSVKIKGDTATRLLLKSQVFWVHETNKVQIEIEQL